MFMRKTPDIIVCLGDYDNGKKLRYLSYRAEKIELDLQLRVCISSSYRKTTILMNLVSQD